MFTTVHKGVSDESRIIILSLNLEDINRCRHTVNVSNSFCIDNGYTVGLHTKYLPIKLSCDTVSDMFICRKVIRTKAQEHAQVCRTVWKCWWINDTHNETYRWNQSQKKKSKHLLGINILYIRYRYSYVLHT